MSRRIRTAKGVIWHPITDSLWVAVAPARSFAEKCLLLQNPEVRLLDMWSTPLGVPEDKLNPSEMDLAKRWLIPEFRLVEEAKELAPSDSYADLAYTIFNEYTSANKLEGHHDLAAYHRTQITDPYRQFEEVEMTVSHLYREPHVALGGKSYGARFAQALIEQKSVKEGFRILEVGCGTGIFGREFLKEVKNISPNMYDSLEYTFFDISPVLNQSQKETNREHIKSVSFQTGDAYTHSFPEERFDLVITNEMIADLPVTKLSKEDTHRSGPEAEAWDLCKNLNLDLSDAPPQFVLNIGALRFLINLSRTLKRGGKAYIVEYGSPHGYPVAWPAVNHVEYSIHFGHMLTASKTLCLEANLFHLPEFLGFVGDLEVLEDLNHLAIFSHLLPFLGKEVESSRVYTRNMLAKTLPRIFPRIENLSFVSLNSLGGIVYPRGFYVLRIVKGHAFSRLEPLILSLL